MTSTHMQPELGQEDMSREFSLSFSNIVKYMQVTRHIIQLHFASQPACGCDNLSSTTAVKLLRTNARCDSRARE